MATDLPPPSSSAPAVSDDDALRCPACDYDLRALSGDRCPECGLAIDHAALSQSQIPWAHRARIGRFRAYRKTVWMVFRHPKKVAADSSRPVSLDDALAFRRVTVFLAFLPLLGLGLWWYFAALQQWLRDRRLGVIAEQSSYFTGVHARVPVAPPGLTLGWVMEGVGVAFAACCLWLFLLAVTGVASYFFHPPNLSIVRQNRAVALSYYACAPLAWTFLPAFTFTGMILLAICDLDSSDTGFRVMVACSIVSYLALGIQLASWWRCSTTLLRHATRCGGVRVAAFALSMPVCGVLLGVLILVVLPLVFVGVAVVVLSFS
jgi:hypothetical protein